MMYFVIALLYWPVALVKAKLTPNADVTGLAPKGDK